MGVNGTQHAGYEYEIIIYVWICMRVLIFCLFIVRCWEKKDVAVIFQKPEENNFQWNLHSNNLVCSYHMQMYAKAYRNPVKMKDILDFGKISSLKIESPKSPLHIRIVSLKCLELW